MSIKRMDLSATKNIDPLVAEATWWLQRWITGSMRDPDWDASWLTKVKTVEQAFTIIHNLVGNAHSVNRVLWRYLSLSKAVAKRIETEKILKPYKRKFQSFTLTQKHAENLDLFLGGEVELLVSCKPSKDAVMFGWDDLKNSKDLSVKASLAALQDWKHQQEVVVLVDKPIKLLSTLRLPPR